MNEEDPKDINPSIDKVLASEKDFKKQSQGKNLGDILVEAKMITENQLHDALSYQQGEGKGRRLGEILVERELVTEEDLLKALALQLDLPFYDILPINDIGIINSLVKIYGEDKKNINFEKYFLLWSPWNTVASWYLWRNIDQKIISY